MSPTAEARARAKPEDMALSDERRNKRPRELRRRFRLTERSIG
jgi:hypothetical protein